MPDQFSPYFSQDQPTVFIGGYWIDDARALEYQATDPKEPLYGFRDVHFREMARGQTVVHGMLDINFRGKGYLQMMLARIAKISSTLKSPDFAVDLPIRTANDALEAALLAEKTDQRNEFQDAGIDPRKIAPADYQVLLNKPFQEFNIEGFGRISKALQSQYWGQDSSLLLENPEEHRKLTAAEQFRASHFPAPNLAPKPFDMTIVYENITDSELEPSPTSVEIIRDVYIVSQSKMIVNAVPGGGEAIVERYQFIAREVE